MTKKYTAIFTSDIHMSNKLPYAQPTHNGMTDRLEDQLKLWKKIGEVADDRGIDDIFVLGDLYDKALVDAVTLTHTVKAIVGLGRTVHILPGNHDANSLTGGRFTVEAFGEMGNPLVKVLRDGELRVTDWLSFWPIEYMPVSATRDKLAEVKKQVLGNKALDIDKKINVLLFHNSIIGCEHMDWVCDDGLTADEVCEGFDWVLSGHFHTHQKFGEDGKGVYLGAPMHHHFGDVGRKAKFWVVEFDEDGGRKMTPQHAAMPKFHKYSGLDHAGRLPKPGDYVRYEIEATHADWEKIKPKAEAKCAAMRDGGFRADYKHKPIYHHESRIGVSGSGSSTSLTVRGAVNEYIKSAGVVSGDLDPKKLKKLGRDILLAVESENATV